MRAGGPLAVHVTPDLTNLATGVKTHGFFTPPKHLPDQPGLRVRAFSIDQLKEDELKMLDDLITQEAEILGQTSERSGNDGNFAGQLRYHPGTGLLIASGGNEFVEMAATLVEAYKETRQNRAGVKAP